MRIFKSIYFFAVVMAAIMCSTACSDDNESMGGGLPDYEYMRTLTASPSSVQLNGATPDEVASVLKWQGYNYTSSTSLQFCAKKDFAADSAVVENVKLTSATDTTTSLTHSRLNDIAASVGFDDSREDSLYVRVKYVRSHSLGYRYSRVAALAVTPYETQKEMDITGADMTSSLGKLYSNVGEKGVYRGLANMEADAAVAFKDYKNTLWGQAADDNFALLAGSGSLVSMPAHGGWYQFVVDTNSKTWTTTLITSLKVEAGGQWFALKYDATSASWSTDITSTGPFTISKVVAKGRRYSRDSGLDDQKAQDVEETIDVSAADGGEGRYLLTLQLEGGKVTTALNESTLSDERLMMVDKDNYSTVKCKLYSPQRNSVFTGLYRLDGWENFRFATEDGAKVYGSVPNELYKLDSSQSAWDIWNDEDAPGMFLITANLEANTWGKQKISSVTVAGDFNRWSTDKDAMTYDVSSKTWQAKVEMTGSGTFTILLNKDWTMRFGQTAEGALGYGSDESLLIPQPSVAGTYLLTLDTYDMGHIVYSLKKQ